MPRLPPSLTSACTYFELYYSNDYMEKIGMIMIIIGIAGGGVRVAGGGVRIAGGGASFRFRGSSGCRGLIYGLCASLARYVF